MIDVRSMKEFKQGRPANSVWGKDCSQYRKQNFEKLDNADIKKIWEHLKINYEGNDKGMCFYCEKGFRSAEVFMYAMDLGLKNVKSFNGFLEWDANELPIESG